MAGISKIIADLGTDPEQFWGMLQNSRGWSKQVLVQMVENQLAENWRQVENAAQVKIRYYYLPERYFVAFKKQLKKYLLIKFLFLPYTFKVFNIDFICTRP